MKLGSCEFWWRIFWTTLYIWLQEYEIFQRLTLSLKYINFLPQRLHAISVNKEIDCDEYGSVYQESVMASFMNSCSPGLRFGATWVTQSVRELGECKCNAGKYPLINVLAVPWLTRLPKAGTFADVKVGEGR